MGFEDEKLLAKCRMGNGVPGGGTRSRKAWRQRREGVTGSQTGGWCGCRGGREGGPEGWAARLERKENQRSR